MRIVHLPLWIFFLLLLNAALASGLMDYLTESCEWFCRFFYRETPSWEIPIQNQATIYCGGEDEFIYDKTVFASIEQDSNGDIHANALLGEFDVQVYTFLALFRPRETPERAPEEEMMYKERIEEQVAAGKSRAKARKAAKKAWQKGMANIQSAPPERFTIDDTHDETPKNYQDLNNRMWRKAVDCKKFYASAVKKAETFGDQRAAKKAQGMLTQTEQLLADLEQPTNQAEGYEYVESRVDRGFRISQGLINRLEAIYIFRRQKLQNLWMRILLRGSS